MKAVRRLAKETIIYGLTTVIARALNLILTPLQTYALNDDTASYGVVTKLLAFVTFLHVIYTYGMETAFFRFATNSKEPRKVSETLSTSLVFTTLLFSAFLMVFSDQLATLINLPGKGLYVRLFGATVALDTLAVIPFAQLRLDSKPRKYMAIKVLNVVIAVLINLFFFLPGALDKPDMFAPLFTFNSADAPIYVFTAFIAASSVQLLVFLPFYLKRKLRWNKAIFAKAWNYSWPLIILGLAGMTNEVLDRMVLDSWLSGTEQYKKDQLGIYGASYKVGMILGMAVQAFRMAADPFFFKSGKAEASRVLFADVMKFFVLFSLTVLLGILMYLDLFARFIGPEFRQGLFIVPYVGLASVFLGIFYNLNIWYKLTDKTHFGMYVTVVGAIVTVALNWFLLPTIGILGAAIATLAAYVVMSVISYFLGQKYFPVPYQVGRILGYIALVLLIYLSFTWFSNQLGLEAGWSRMAFNTPGLLIFIGIVYVAEKENIKALFARKSVE